jgi:uncharacterized ParB-like nuclease family protein
MQDYPERTTKWLDDAVVQSPSHVPLSNINEKNRSSWAASKSPAKLAHFKQRMAQGQTKPILVTKAPGENQYNIVDGHHRYLAAKSLGAPSIHAWVVHVPQKVGEWTHMHSAQTPYGPNGIREPVKKSADAMVSHFTSDMENTSKPTKKCDYCQRPATKLFYSKQGGGIMARSCAKHAEQARAEMRWTANNQVSPSNPSPYAPFPRVLTQ